MDLMTFLYATLLLFVSARGLAHRYLKTIKISPGRPRESGNEFL